jgi:two-component system, response regulator
VIDAPQVLLVEDNDDDARLALRALGRHDAAIAVEVVCDGDETLARLLGDEPRRLPDLVLLDLHLPGRGGLDVLRMLRAAPRTRRLPVVVLTSSLQPSDLAAGYELGASSYIRKAVDFSRFCEVVAGVCQYWFELNEAPPAD